MDPEKTGVQISLFDWEQLQQELILLRQRIVDLEHQLEMVRTEANVWARIALGRNNDDCP